MMKSLPTPLAVLARGEGARVWDVDGTEYLDFLAGIAVNALGHAHPVFVDAVSQPGRDPRARLELLRDASPQIELAERLAPAHRRVARVLRATRAPRRSRPRSSWRGCTGRPRILALEDSFHGRTTGSLSLTGKPAHARAVPAAAAGRRAHRRHDRGARGGHGRRRRRARSSSRSRARRASSTCPAGYLAAARRADASARRPADPRRDPDRRRPHRRLVRLPARPAPDRARRDHASPRASAAASRSARSSPSGRRASCSQPGHHGIDLRRQPARHGDRERRARRDRARRPGRERAAPRRAAARRDRSGSRSPLVTDIQGRGLLLGIGLARAGRRRRRRAEPSRWD